MKSLINLLIVSALTTLIISSCKKENNIIIEPIDFNPSVSYGNLIDQDGNEYRTVTIGTQTWMAENLRTTKYRNGDAITFISDTDEWINLTSEAFCYFNNQNLYKYTYGCLYNAYAVIDSRNIAPPGWHVPTIDEWETLMAYLGGSKSASIRLKEKGNIHWKPPINHQAGVDLMINEAIGTNESGFTAMPSGQRDRDGNYDHEGLYAYFWTNTEYTDFTDWYVYIGNYNYVAIPNNWPDMRISHNFQKQIGISVRCLKD